MKFIENISEKEYIKFFNKNKEAHFLQSYAWGILNQKTRKLTPMFVGLKDDKNSLVAASLLLKKKTPLNMCYFYAPRGFLIDFSDKHLVEEWTNKLKEFLQKENAIYLKVDPGISYQDIDDDGNKINDGSNNYELYDLFLKLGYKHKGFNKLYERNQPRYTFRIDTQSDMNEIEKRMNRTFMKTVRRSYDYDLEIALSNDIETFHKLTQNNAEKDDFKSYSLNYYQEFFNIFKKYDSVKIFEARIKPKEVLKKLEDKLNKKDLTTQKVDEINQINRLKKDIELFSPLKEKEIVVGSLICVYAKNRSWTLYIGNNDLGMKTSAINRLYYEAIKDAHENNYEFIDLFGTVGDPKTTYKNLAGLHDFKRKMGGKYIEFIGEFDLINKKFWYKVLPSLLKIYRKIRG